MCEAMSPKERNISKPVAASMAFAFFFVGNTGQNTHIGKFNFVSDGVELVDMMYMEHGELFHNFVDLVTIFLCAAAELHV